MPNKLNALNTNSTVAENSESIKDAYVFLVQKLANTQEAKDIQHLLNALLTDKEQHEIANRIKIFALLQQGLPQRAISEQLGVGIATVSRGAKAYQYNEVDTLLPNLSSSLDI